MSHNRHRHDCDCPVHSRPKRTLAERFWPKVQVCAPDECWLWLGSKNTKGYGSIVLEDGRRATAHRVAFCLAFGVRVLPSLVVAHKCDNPSCVNPAHLLMTTQRENIRDMIEKGRGGNPLYLANAAKTHCVRGHPFEGDNLAVSSRGRRACRACRAIYRARRAKAA